MLQCFYGKLELKDGYGFLETAPEIDGSMIAFIERNAKQFGKVPGRNTVLLPYIDEKTGIVQYLFFHKCKAYEPNGRDSGFLHIVIMKSSELQTSLRNNHIAQMKFCEDRASIGNYRVATAPYLYRDQNVIMESLSSRVPVKQLYEIIEKVNWREGKVKKSKLFIAFPPQQADELDRVSRSFLQAIFIPKDIKFMLKIDFITNAVYSMDIEDLHIICCQEEECARFREKYGDKCYYYFVGSGRLLPAREEELDPYLNKPQKANPRLEEQKTVTTEDFVKPNHYKEPVKSRAGEIQDAKHDMMNRNDRNDAGGHGKYQDTAPPGNKQGSRSAQEESDARRFLPDLQSEIHEISKQNRELSRLVKRGLTLSAVCVCLGIFLLIGSMILMLRSPKAQDARKEAVENGSGLSGGTVGLSQTTYDELRAMMGEAVRAEINREIPEDPAVEPSDPAREEVATPSQIEISAHTRMLGEPKKPYVELEELKDALVQTEYSVADEQSGAGGAVVYFFKKIENNRVSGFQILGVREEENTYVPVELLKQRGIIIISPMDDAPSGN